MAVVVCVILGGTATAGQLITGADIKNGSLTLKDFKASERSKLKGPRGQRGPVGPQGVAGPTGAAGAPGATGAAGSAGATGATGPAGSLDPVPAARLRSASGTSVPAGGTAATASWEVETYDTANLHSDSAPTRLTAPIDGIYAISSSSRWSPTPGGDRALLLVRNGTTNISAQIGPVTTSSFAFIQNVNTQYRLAAGDFIEVQYTQSTASAVSTLASSSESSPTFAMTWVGPG